MGVSLFNKYRPQTFGDLIGQKSAVEIITNSIMKSFTGHAYLFSGSRGCGKTSAARIFAKALNCKNPNGYEPCGKCTNCTAITAGESLDVSEIDGASNNGVENIRGLKENVTLAPFNSRWKIYIIDEVHMLSTGAFNALLKTLEEPPEYVIFIMATTEPQKVPVTIRSRCQHIPFHSITPEDIFSRLQYVCTQEGVNAESDALWEISRQADGALRDALSLLEQVIASGDITLQNVERTTGAGSRPAFERWIKTFRTDSSEGYMILKSMFDAGASGLRVFEEMFSLVRNLWLISRWKNIAGSLGASEQEKSFMNDEISHWKSEDLHRLLNVIVKILSEARRGVKPDILLGMFMLYLESEPEELSQPLLPKVSVTHEEPMPAKFPEEKKPESVMKPEPVRKPKPPAPPAINDPVLKEKVLENAHARNFLMYSVLFDADVHEDEGDLILNMRHIYCFAWLKATRHAADLRSMFRNYREVIVCHEHERFACIDYESVMPFEEEKEKPSFDVTDPKYQAVMSVPAPEKPVIIVDDEPEPELSAISSGNEPSRIGKFISELIRCNAKPEVLMIRKNENENESEDENSDERDEGENEE